MMIAAGFSRRLLHLKERRQRKGKLMSPETVSINVGGVSVLMKAEGDRVVHHERFDKMGFEPKSLECWSQMIKPGGVALDVGAYTGLYAIAAAKLGATAIAIEPIPANARRLLENAKLNQVEIILIEAAASDKDDEGFMFAPGATGLPSGAKVARTSRGHAWGQVKLVRIDSLDLPGITAVKMDVERHEVKALRGAAKLFSDCMPSLLIEALGVGECLAIQAALPGYVVDEVLDRRNLLMTPKRR